jgi:protein STE50
MAFKTAYHEGSDADDEYERSVIASPALPPDFESSPTDSDPPSAEHTPTTFTHSVGSHASPTGLITQWTAGQCADFVSNLGMSQYADAFVGEFLVQTRWSPVCSPGSNHFTEEAITGEALVAVQHSDLKEIGMTSVGHRLKVLKAVYDVKIKQNVSIEPDHYIPLCTLRRQLLTYQVADIS